MPVFNYTVKDIDGAYHKGEIEAADPHEAAKVLQRKKLFIISIKNSNATRGQLFSLFKNRVPFSNIVVMTRQLATMIEAGLVLSDALDILVEQQENKNLKKILEDITHDVQGGLDFASALDKHQDVFPKLYINLVRAGETSGKLDIILIDLATTLEKQREFNSKVRGAMIYPVIVVTLMFVVMAVMVFFVIPRLTSLYSQSDIELPLPTKILITTSDLSIKYWWIMTLIVGLIVLMYRRWVSTPQGRLAVDTQILKLPIIGRIVKLVVLTNFTRTFALLVGAGIPILETLKIVSGVVGNTNYKNALDVAYQGVERGLTLSAQILSFPQFPKIVGQMIRTGEETGKLDEVMDKLANYFESEADETFKNITTLIEPIVLILLGLGVGFLVLSIILPIYKLTTSIQ
jgi:type IV pilus assembly protein PilC